MQRKGAGGDVWEASPTSHFDEYNFFINVFDEYNFFMILNLFDDNNPYPLSTRKSKMCDQNASYRYLGKNSELVAKNFK